MIQKRFPALVILLMLSQGLFSQTVLLQDAAKAAQRIYSEKIPAHLTDRQAEISEAKTVSKNGAAVYHIVNFSSGGFVVIAAEQSVTPVLCYGYSGVFDHANIPPAVARWMDDYAAQIELSRISGYQAAPEVSAEWDRLMENPYIAPTLKSNKSVAPLLHSTWNQGKYYNDFCPADPLGPDGRTYAGCVPTAMGQIMNYFRHPQQGMGSYKYYHADYDTISADFGATTYFWDDMPLSLMTYNDAIAQLLFHLGVSVDLNYGPNGSGMYNHKAAYSLRTYFGYAPATEYVFRDTCTLNWSKLLTDHLDQGIPLYYAGWADTINVSGHAFVCDGYQDTSYFHFNWGWGGTFDGYFYIDNLTPGGSDFTLDHELIINCMPDTSLVYPHFCNGHTFLNQNRGTFGDGSGPLHNYAPYSECYWLIDPVDSVNKIILEFLEFDTDANDIVTVFRGRDTLALVIGQYSGSSLPATINATTSALFVRFRTNDSIESSGWLAEYRTQLPVFCSGITDVTSSGGTLTDGSGNANYNNNSLCRWRILPAGVTSIQIHFNQFDLAADDYIEIYDQVSGLMIARFTGDSTVSDVICNSDKALILFKTNARNTAQGWELTYTSVSDVSESQLPESAIRISPNPSDGAFNIYGDMGGSDRTAIICIYNARGSLTKKITVNIQNGILNSDIDPGMIPAGIYHVVLMSETEIFHQNMIIK
jgi:hypothetical protein